MFQTTFTGSLGGGLGEGEGGCTLDFKFQVMRRYKWGYIKSRVWSKTQKNPLDQNETQNTSTQKGLNDNKEEQQYFLNGCVCFFFYN